ncbi:MAG: glycosyltransferase family 4 protein [Lachnospiraceae bacterium]|nr:glycosyltransferase family 4 protein [Lachnospiraceae bacterium]
MCRWRIFVTNLVLDEVEKKEIVLIGPVYPYKGGISHYTGLMYKALANKFDVTMVSYKVQYPKILFRKEQKDYTNDVFKIDKTNYWLNTVNPLNIIAVAKKINRMRPDLVVIQWWHPYFAPCYWILSRFLKNTKILFICHNVFPHERFPMDKFLTKKALKKGNYYIVQSKQDEEDLKTIMKEPIYTRTVHPTYNAFKFENLSKEKARQLIQVKQTEKILLFFGFVREYKGLKYLIKALPLVKEKLENVKLLIVGDFGSDKQSYLDLIIGNKVEDIIDIHDGYIPDREVEKYFASCDLVVLPYESATQSGIVQIAYGFEKPVIVTDVGGLPDVVTDGKTGYVVEAKSPMALAEAVKKYFLQNKEEEFVENVRSEAYRFGWERMVEKLEMFL